VNTNKALLNVHCLIGDRPFNISLIAIVIAERCMMTVVILEVGLASSSLYKLASKERANTYCLIIEAGAAQERSTISCGSSSS
jgi:hypothetical protein